MEYSTTTILSRYKELKDRLHRAPIAVEFYYETGFKRQGLNKIFGNKPYRKIQEKCGDAPYRVKDSRKRKAGKVSIIN